MSTYKVIQDIEAEDKLLGPFSFRQFVYLLIAAFLGYLNFICIARGAAFLTIVFVPPMVFCLFFAWPWSPDQPTEIWALARIRFLVKSRKRIWDQSGVKEFVTITVPKKIERNYTDGLTQTEVRSRLHALANTIDSRGWAVKNASLNDALVPAAGLSDRLVDFSAMPTPVSDLDVRAGDDVLDEINNPIASQMNAMINASSQAHRQGIIERLRGATTTQAQPTAAPRKPWFAPNAPAPTPVITQNAQTLQPMTLPPKAPSANANLKTLMPVADMPAPANDQPAPIAAPVTPVPAAQPMPPAQPAAPAVHPASDAAILNLAHDNNMDVATLAREAKKARELDDQDGEVVISLR